MSKQEWLNELKVGDKVGFFSRQICHEVGIVTEINKTSITVAGLRFSKRTGKLINASTVRPPRIYPIVNGRLENGQRVK